MSSQRLHHDGATEALLQSARGSHGGTVRSGCTSEGRASTRADARAHEPGGRHSFPGRRCGHVWRSSARRRARRCDTASRADALRLPGPGVQHADDGRDVRRARPTRGPHLPQRAPFEPVASRSCSWRASPSRRRSCSSSQTSCRTNNSQHSSVTPTSGASSRSRFKPTRRRRFCPFSMIRRPGSRSSERSCSARSRRDGPRAGSHAPVSSASCRRSSRYGCPPARNATWKRRRATLEPRSTVGPRERRPRGSRPWKASGSTLTTSSPLDSSISRRHR